MRRRAYLLSLALLSGLLPLGCRKGEGTVTGKSPGARADAGARRPAIVLESAELTEAASAVLRGCEVTSFGFIRNCKGGEDAALTEQERAVGLKRTLLSYCRVMENPSHTIRALAAARISRLTFYRPLAEEADEGVLRCLLDVLPRTKQSQLARPLVRAAAYMAAAMKREAEVLSFLAGCGSTEVNAAGYESLWANGRLRVLPHLERLLKESKEQEVRAAIVVGFAFGGRMEGEEFARICDLLVSLMADPNLRVASTAAVRVADLCPEQRDRVLDAALIRVERRAFDLGFINAVRTVNGFFAPRASATQKKRSVALLVRVVQGDGFSDLVRAAALRNLAAISKADGLKLARKHEKHGSQFIRAAAAEVLRQK